MILGDLSVSTVAQRLTCTDLRGRDTRSPLPNGPQNARNGPRPNLGRGPRLCPQGSVLIRLVVQALAVTERCGMELEEHRRRIVR